MPRLHETINGKRLLERDIPQAVKDLKTIAEEMKRANDINESLVRNKAFESLADELVPYLPAVARLIREYAKE